MILDAIPGLSKLLDYFSQERHRREDRKELALSAIFAAASETRLYLAGLERSGRRNRKKEEELSRLWTRAALAARRFDAEFTERCLMKSQYWESPEKWRAEEVTEKRIGIEAVYEKALQLLLSK